ncbi:MAG: CDGSH iron-sulfur domain-containing protein [Magnetococcus sp. MYC-9]
MPNSPIAAELAAGQHHVCRCGLSANQPHCDGSHQNTRFTPVAITLDKPAEVYVCRCNKTAAPPYCDGSHQHP